MNKKILLALLILLIVAGAIWMIVSQQDRVAFERINSVLQEAPGVTHTTPSCNLITYGYSVREAVISTDTEFNSLIDEWLRCDGFENISIDFNSKTLLGKFAFGGCGADKAFKVVVRRSDKNKTVSYQLERERHDICDGMYPTMNWVLVDKIPAEYEVIFTKK
jgi:hypothetical protein